MKNESGLNRGRHAALPDWAVPVCADNRSWPSDLSNEEGPRSNVPVRISDLL
jgi:hypothetical protein